MQGQPTDLQRHVGACFYPKRLFSVSGVGLVDLFVVVGRRLREA